VILALALTNLLLGLAYTGYGVITAVEMRRDWRAFGFSRFGAAWIAMAFTCGPHHLAHGVHLAFEGRHAGPLDLLAVVVGLPAGITWLALRIEAFRGGRGDRFIVGDPAWLRAVPAASGLYLGVLTLTSIALLGGEYDVEARSLIVANFLLVGIYTAIGWFILRTQLRNHPVIGGWSVSGLCLSVIFPTCALMHGVWAVYALKGTYHNDIHGAVIDWLSVPAALYFLFVVRRLYQNSLHDWNQGPDAVAVDVPTFSGFTGTEPLVARPPALGDRPLEIDRQPDRSPDVHAVNRARPRPRRG
jgi:hypothetical protein